MSEAMCRFTTYRDQGLVILGFPHAGVSNARRRQHEQVPVDELGVWQS